METILSADAAGKSLRERQKQVKGVVGVEGGGGWGRCGVREAKSGKKSWKRIDQRPSDAGVQSETDRQTCWLCGRVTGG